MHESESAALRRALVLLLVVSGGRWLHGRTGGAPEPPVASVASELSEAVGEAAAEVARRGRPLEPGERIDPNRAPEVELDRLPGVGPATASAIVAARDSGQIFRVAADLTRVRGIGPSTVQRLEGLLDLDRPPARRGPGNRLRRGLLDLNRAGSDQLATLPGIGPAIAERILQRRARRRFRSVSELVEVPGIGPAKMERLRPLVRVGPGP